MTLDHPLTRHGVLEIVTFDHGSRLACNEFIAAPTRHEIRFSMRGNCCFRDNAFVERLWTTIEREENQLYADDTASVAKGSLTRFLGFHSRGHPDTAFDRPTRDTAYFARPPLAKVT